MIILGLAVSFLLIGILFIPLVFIYINSTIQGRDISHLRGQLSMFMQPDNNSYSTNEGHDVYRTADGKHSAPTKEELLRKIMNDPSYNFENSDDEEEWKKKMMDDMDDDEDKSNKK